MKKCENCSDNFIPKRITAKYCSQSCKARAYEKRKGIEEPKFLNNTQENKLEVLKSKRTELIKQYNSLLNKLKNIKNEYENKETSLSKPINPKGFEIAFGAKSFIEVLAGVGIAKLEINQEKENQKMLKKHKATKGNVDEEIKKINAELSNIKDEVSQINKNISKLELNVVRKAEIKQIERKVFDIKEILNTKFNSFNFEGQYKVLGNPESNFKMQIWGTKGQGKSYFTVKFADYLSRFGKVFYNTSEEGISLSFQNKIRTLQNIDRIKIGIHKDYKSLKKDIKKENFQFLILDSLTDMNMTIDDLSHITALNPKIAIIYITQATKDGRSKGDEKLGHFADIVIKINNREIEVEKSRYV